MLITAADKIRDWKGLKNADREAKKQARFQMQDRAQKATGEQTWVPEQVIKEIRRREETRGSKRFQRRR